MIALRLILASEINPLFLRGLYILFGVKGLREQFHVSYGEYFYYLSYNCSPPSLSELTLK